MRKAIIVGIVLIVAAGFAFFGGTRSLNHIGDSSDASGKTQSVPNSISPGDFTGKPINGASNSAGTSAGTTESVSVDSDDAASVEIQPAAKIYHGSAEAVEALKKASTEYNDIIIEQFREPGPDCTWCDEMYKSLRNLLTGPGLKKEEISYFGEILAISGRVDNLQFLAELVKNTADRETQEMYAQAIELASGDDDVVQYLSEEMSSTNERLQEAAVAAITNQGTRQAAEILYKHTVAKDDPDGYYSVGIGLGEFVPDDDAIPYVQELLLKRDKFSHLAVKSLMNAGLPGLRLVFESITNSKDTEQDRHLLEGAIEHVLIDKETEEFVNQALHNTSNEALLEFGREVVSRFQPEE